MKLLTVGALSALSLLAAGCSGCQTTPDQPIAGQTVADEKALYAAEAALFGANTAAKAAVTSGLLQPGSPDAVKVADFLEQARKALLAGRAAYDVGDATDLAGRIAASQALIGQAWALIPSKPQVQ